MADSLKISCHFTKFPKIQAKRQLSQANEKVQFLTDPGMTFSTKKKLRTKVLLLGKKP
jgi:hypothetical protein